MFRSPMAHSNKTCFEPSQQITFLDYVLNLVNITVSPKQKKVNKIIDYYQRRSIRFDLLFLLLRLPESKKV